MPSHSWSSRSDRGLVRIHCHRSLKMIAYLDGRDPTTRRMLEEILSNEEEHADDLNSLLEGLQVK